MADSADTKLDTQLDNDAERNTNVEKKKLLPGWMTGFGQAAVGSSPLVPTATIFLENRRFPR